MPDACHRTSVALRHAGSLDPPANHHAVGGAAVVEPHRSGSRQRHLLEHHHAGNQGRPGSRGIPLYEQRGHGPGVAAGIAVPERGQTFLDHGLIGKPGCRHQVSAGTGYRDALAQPGLPPTKDGPERFDERRGMLLDGVSGHS